MNMNREIKFRGKRVKMDDPLERWIEGSCVEYTNIRDKKVVRIMSKSGYQNEVYPETVGQFTGLHDNNGKEIYEGDIVKTKEYEIDIANRVFCSNVAGYDTFLITWNNGGFILENYKRHFRLCGGSHFEVIGNIYDNKELLK